MPQPDRNNFPKDPNIDFVFEYSGSQPLEVAVECKFTEPFGRQHGGLKEVYLQQEDLWKEIPELYALAKKICPDAESFDYLHVAQLVKHLLGLLFRLKSPESNIRTARLLYLYYDVAGDEGYKHLKEIREFQSIVSKQFPNDQPIRFQYMTYQDALLKLALKHRDQHPAYFGLDARTLPLIGDTPPHRDLMGHALYFT